MIPRVDRELTKKLEAEILPLLTEYGQTSWAILKSGGWKMLVVNHRCGRCYYRKRVVTVPVWAFSASKDNGYRAWYLGHEISHAVAGPGTKHGPLFMAQLKVIVPEAWAHYEYGYKPRNAKAAGIALADGTIPQRAPKASRGSLHPQSVINAKNLHLRNCLGVWMQYQPAKRLWVLRDQTNGYALIPSAAFANASATDMEEFARKILDRHRSREIN